MTKPKQIIYNIATKITPILLLGSFVYCLCYNFYIKGEKKENIVYSIATYIDSVHFEDNSKSYEFFYNGNQFICNTHQKNIIEILKDKEIGSRFLIKIETSYPYRDQLLIDIPVPIDIDKAPENGWKKLPDWNKEREKGNVKEFLCNDNYIHIRKNYITKKDSLFMCEIMRRIKAN